MSPLKTQTIEVDEATASALTRRAAERGLSVSQLVAEMAGCAPSGASNATEQIEELDRRWERLSRGQGTVPNDDVVRWLETWGTTAFRPWSDK